MTTYLNNSRLRTVDTPGFVRLLYTSSELIRVSEDLQKLPYYFLQKKDV